MSRIFAGDPDQTMTPLLHWFLLQGRRDLRARWLPVAAIALVIGLGTGVYAGLGSTAAWRQQSNDASFAHLALHDLRVRMAADSYIPEGRLLSAIDRMDHPEWVLGAEERLVVPTQFEAPGPNGAVLVSGELNGVALPGRIDQLHPRRGRSLQSSDRGTSAAVLEHNVAKATRLADAGTLRLANGAALQWVGQALQPEWFVATDPNAGYIGGASYQVVFTSLPTAQRVSDRAGLVNDLVLLLQPGVDRSAAADELEQALQEIEPPVASTVTNQAEVPAYRLLYQDIEGDQKVWRALSIIILAGAAFAAANLVARMIDAQRRELGIGMALGVPPGTLALRPLFTGLQIGLLGVVAGVAVGLAVNAAFRSVLDSALPLPIWRTPFQIGMFAQAALLGMVVPLLATLAVVRRAVRMRPLDALARNRPTLRRKRVRSANRRRSAMRQPHSLTVLPWRDLRRAPRRTVLAAVGIATSISVLVGVLGMMDSFLAVVDRTTNELGAERGVVSVELTQPQPESSAALAGLVTATSAQVATSALLIAGELRGRAADTVPVLVEAGDLAPASGWAPNVDRGRLPGPGEVLLAAKALVDLDVELGDTVWLRHARFSPDGGAEMVVSSFRVAGTHANPLRALVYVTASVRAAFGMDGLVNQVRLEPAQGTTPAQLERAVFGQPGVRTARSVAATAQQVRDGIDQYLALLRIVELIPLLLALLVGFNASVIGAEEARRDHATMFAFGVTPRRVLGLLSVEALVLGVVGSALGIAGGWVLARWVVEVVVPDTLPEIGLQTYLSPGSVALAAIGGVVAVAAGPLLVHRRLRRMDVPSVLRVVE
ncbi:MAG: ABC transporter permease [Acidimicrobiales bacterium]